MTAVEEGRLMMSSARICQLLMIHMTGGAPFGFRVASINLDGISPFAVSMMRINGKAYRAGLLEGDLVLAINGFSCCSKLSHHSATKLMEYDDPELTLHILRGENICDDDIKTSLQSLDSQILELTDHEVQSVIAKKQLQQHVGSPVSTSKHTNSLRHANVSPFRLQPPPITRPKMVEKINDMLSLSEVKDRAVTDWTPNESTDDKANHTWTKLKAKSSYGVDAIVKTDQLNISEATEVINDFQLSYQPINELKGKAFNRISRQKYQPNDKEQQSQWTDLPADDKISSQSKLTPDNFDSALSPIASSEIERTSQNNVSKERKNSNNQLRNRYRVEQNILFKPVDQKRHYDAESGQFRETSSEKISKRRSNSISCYHMYMSSGTPNPSSILENRGHTQKPDGFNCWKPIEDNHNQFDGTVHQWSDEGIKKQVTEHDHGISKSPFTAIQLPRGLPPGITKTYMSSSVDLSQQFYPTVTLSHVEASNMSHSISNRPFKSATIPIDQLQTSSKNRETKGLSFSDRQVSPEVSNLPLSKSNSHHRLALSSARLLPSFGGIMLHQESPESILNTSRALPKLIHLRSTESEDCSSSAVRTRCLSANGTAIAKVKPSRHDGGLRSVIHDGKVNVSPRPRTAAASVFETNQQQTQSEETSHNTQKANSSTDQRWTMNADRNSVKTLLGNEGKGGRVFARQRANSDAWIVSEREEPNNSVAKSMISDNTGMQIISVPGVMPRRRRSFIAGHLQQPVQSRIGNNSLWYMSTTTPKLVNNFSSPRPFNEMQYSKMPNFYSHNESSAGQSGVYQAEQYKVDLNALKPGETTDGLMSSVINQNVRPYQAGLHPLYHQANEANRYAVQPNTGCTDL